MFLWIFQICQLALYRFNLLKILRLQNTLRKRMIQASCALKQVVSESDDLGDAF
jgi:hypothetical protein